MTRLSIAPEEQMLVALGKPRPCEQDWVIAETALSNPEFDWPAALRLSRAHLIQAMLAWNLKSRDDVYARLPRAVRTELTTALLCARARRVRYQQALAPVFDELESRGIPIILMKGAVVMETAYPPDSRWLNDLDMLVPVNHRSVAIDTLCRNGFRALSGVPHPDAYHEVSLVREGDAGSELTVDLHWQVYPDTRPFRFDVKGIFDRARPQTFGEHQVLGMSPEDTFVHLATQLLNDHFQTRLLRFCDLYSLLSGSEPQRVSAIAAASGAAGITHTALSALLLLGARVPGDLLESLARGCPGCGIGSSFLADHRWLFGARRPAFGAISVITPFYFPDAGRRRHYRWSWPLMRYAYERGTGSSTFVASVEVVYAMVSLLMCSAVLVMITTAGPRAAERRLRDLLWRNW